MEDRIVLYLLLLNINNFGLSPIKSKLYNNERHFDSILIFIFNLLNFENLRFNCKI